VKRSIEVAVADHEHAPEQALDCAERLSRFFPRVVPLRIPVQVTAVRGGQSKLREATVVEFGGSEHAIFVCTLPLEFEDRVMLECDARNSTDATVVAVQYHEGRKAVAVKFSDAPCDWVTQP
jgi:hypothetical protein